MGPLCMDQHPASLEWRCTCHKESGHADDHRCYGCGFEWSQTDSESTGAQRASVFLSAPPGDPITPKEGNE